MPPALALECLRGSLKDSFPNMIPRLDDQEFCRNQSISRYSVEAFAHSKQAGWTNCRNYINNSRCAHSSLGFKSPSMDMECSLI